MTVNTSEVVPATHVLEFECVIEMISKIDLCKNGSDNGSSVPIHLLKIIDVANKSSSS